MKKSKSVILASVFVAAVTSCSNPTNQWISGSENGTYRDTTVDGIPCRYYRGSWYPIYNNQINPGIYLGTYHRGSSSSFYHPYMHTGGFGKSAHSSSVSG